MSEELTEMLKSETTVPPGGWRYRCAATGWTLDNPTGGMLEDKVKEVQKHNRANPGKELTDDPLEIRKQVINQTIANLKSIGANREVISVPKTLAPNGTSLSGPQGIIRRVAHVVANDLLGAKIIADWFGKGGHPVIPDIGQRRANACFECPRNSLKVRGGISQIAEVVRWSAEFMADAKLEVKGEEKLGTCTVCGCPLKTKIWVPFDVIDQDKKHKFPSNCWIESERRSSPPLPYDLTPYSYRQDLPEPPPITEQSGWRSGIFQVDTKPGEYWFNPGLIRMEGSLYLASRRMTHPAYKAEIVFLKLDENLKPVGREPLIYKPTYVDEHMEDGRCIPIPGKPNRFYLAASNFFISSNQHQALFEVEKVKEGFKVIREIRIVFGGNSASIGTQKKIEKNWQFFLIGNRVHFVYWIRPNHVVCEVEGNQVVNRWDTETYPTWAYGTPSGGTPPVLIGDLYWSFFHSHQKFTANHRRYFMGVYAFESKPPFRIKYMSKAPILAGTKAHPVTLWHHLVVFPTGAIYDQSKDEWLVTLGVNDCLNAWIKIPHGQLLETVA